MEKSELTPAEKADVRTLATAFKALGNETRVEILSFLIEHSLRVSDIAKALRLTPASVSRHVHQLAAGGWVTFEREGAGTWCSVPPAVLVDWREAILGAVAGERQTSPLFVPPSPAKGSIRAHMRRRRGRPVWIPGLWRVLFTTYHADMRPWIAVSWMRHVLGQVNTELEVLATDSLGVERRKREGLGEFNHVAPLMHHGVREVVGRPIEPVRALEREWDAVVSVDGAPASTDFDLRIREVWNFKLPEPEDDTAQGLALAGEIELAVRQLCDRLEDELDRPRYWWGAR